MITWKTVQIHLIAAVESMTPWSGYESLLIKLLPQRQHWVMETNVSLREWRKKFLKTFRMQDEKTTFTETCSNVKPMSILHLSTIILPLTSCDSFGYIWDHLVRPPSTCYSICLSAPFSVSVTIFSKHEEFAKKCCGTCQKPVLIFLKPTRNFRKTCNFALRKFFNLQGNLQSL